MKCWICKRTAQEVFDDFEQLYQEHHKKLEEPGHLVEIMSGYEEAKNLDKLVYLRKRLETWMPICAVCEITFCELAVDIICDDIDNGGPTYEQISESIAIDLSDIFSDVLKKIQAKKKEDEKQ